MVDFPCNQAENLVDNKMDLAQLLKLKRISKSTLYLNPNVQPTPCLESTSQMSSQSQGVENRERRRLESAGAAQYNKLNTTCSH